MAEDSSNNTIQLDTMSLEQLDQLKQREESRLQAFTQRFATLRSAAARLSASSAAVTELYNNCDDADDSMMKTAETEATKKDVFVPLTESVYVPGKIKCTAEPLLLELGTGYFVEKSTQETVEFLQRKMQLVDANSENGT
jgi:prefoldin alpha subunit